jgi:transglutaminase-like putative cysteine protease
MAKGQMNILPILIIGAIIVAAVFLYMKPIGSSDPNWDKTYLSKAEQAGIDQSLFLHNSIVDQAEGITNVANDIKSKSINANDAVQKTMEYVYQHVRYTRQTSANACFVETSASVFQTGQGDCVSMTKLVISLLREQGIAARPAGGCISKNFACGAIFAVTGARQPQYEPVDPTDPKKRGGLHEWVEIWLPDQGWVIGEATSGQIFPKSCQSYDYHDYNDDAYGMCVVTDLNYRRQCEGF